MAAFVNIANNTALSVSKIVENSAKIGEVLTEAGVSSAEVVDTTVNLVKKVAETAQKTTQVANAAQDTTIQVLNSSTDIISSGSSFSVETIKALTEQVKNSNVLTKEGLSTITAGISILNNFLTKNNETIVTILGAPLQATGTVLSMVNILLTIILLSPIEAIQEKLENYNEINKIKKENETEFKKILLENERKIQIQNLKNQMELQKQQMDIQQLDALNELAITAKKKRTELEEIQKIKNGGSNSEEVENTAEEVKQIINDNPIEQVKERRTSLNDKIKENIVNKYNKIKEKFAKLKRTLSDSLERGGKRTNRNYIRNTGHRYSKAKNIHLKKSKKIPIMSSKKSGNKTKKYKV